MQSKEQQSFYNKCLFVLRKLKLIGYYCIIYEPIIQKLLLLSHYNYRKKFCLISFSLKLF